MSQTGPLALNQRYFQAIFEHSLDGILLMDDSGRYLDANPSICQLLGYSREELLKLHVWDITPIPHHEQIPDLMRQFIAAGEQNGEYTLLCKDSSTRVVEYRAVANMLPGVHLAVHRDITQRRLAEKELQDREARWRLVVSQLPGAVWTTDRNLRLSSVQGTTASLTGTRVDQELGRHITDFADQNSKDMVEQAHRQALQGQSVNYESTYYGRSFHSYLEPLRDKESAIVGCLGIALETTRQKQAEEKLRVLAERSQALSRRLVEIQEKERRHLARELHDEIGQILTAILYNLQAAKTAGATDATPRLDETITIIGRAIQQVRQLSLDLRPPMLDDLGLTATLQWYTESLAGRTGVTVHLIAPPSGIDLPAEVKNSTFRIAQEALTNVARHSQARQVWVALHCNDGEVSLVVLDDGVGFDVSAAQERAIKGESFGVLGMRERADLLGGRFAIVSRPGQGTAIEVHIPLHSFDQSGEIAIDTDHQDE